VTEAISQLPKLSRFLPAGVVSPHQLYKEAVERDLLGPLRRDPRIGEQIIRQVKQVYLALPPNIQARVLLTAMRHPALRTGSASDVTDPATTGEIVRDLLSAGGVVAVKLAQMIAEDPKVSTEYVWHHLHPKVPPAVRLLCTL
jgi:hypothetical protein